MISLYIEWGEFNGYYTCSSYDEWLLVEDGEERPDHGSAVIVGCDNASYIDRSMRKLRAMITTLYMSTQIFTC